MNTALRPSEVTFANVKAWTADEMKFQLARGPEYKIAIMEAIANRSQKEIEEVAVSQASGQTPEQLAAAQAAADAEAHRVAAEAEAQRVAAVEAAKPKKLVIDYQITDENGKAIGRPTHLEAWSQDELNLKMIKAHTEATRAFHRLKDQKITHASQQHTNPAPQALTDTELTAEIEKIRTGTPAEALAAQRKVTQAEVDRQLASERASSAAAQESARRERATYQFLNTHKFDYNDCDANSNLIKEYLGQNGWEWTFDNLEIAFHAIESELAPVAQPTIATTPVNPVVVPEVPATQVTPQAVQPVVVTPVVPVAPVNPAPAAPRPGVNSSIVPGQSSGVRQQAQATTDVTIADIRSWDGATMRKNMNNSILRPQIEAAIAAHNLAKGRKA